SRWARAAEAPGSRTVIEAENQGFAGLHRAGGVAVKSRNQRGDRPEMNAVAAANLVGITGIARRLVLDGVLDEANAREALDKATAERKPVATWLREKKLVTAAQLAAANSIEFGMPVFDPATMDAEHSAIKLVKEELLRKHCVLPLFKRGAKLFVGTS